jgi:hypothetical protein
MASWRPISEKEFLELFQQQYKNLTHEERLAFDRHRVDPWQARIRRSDMYGYETVFVVARAAPDGVLYFDDVEFGFNISTVDESGIIQRPGGGQFSLKEAIQHWFRSK